VRLSNRYERRARARWYTAAPIVLLASFFVLAGLAEAVPRIVHADTSNESREGC
jgi:hypothetical protein